MDVQSGRATTAPVGEEDVCWARHRVRHHTRGLLGGGQGRGLGSSEDHVSNGVMAAHSLDPYFARANYGLRSLSVRVHLRLRPRLYGCVYGESL